MLNDLVEGFVDSALTFGANMAAQRNSRSVEPKDIAVHLERSWCVVVLGLYTTTRGRIRCVCAKMYSV